MGMLSLRQRLSDAQTLAQQPARQVAEHDEHPGGDEEEHGERDVRVVGVAHVHDREPRERHRGRDARNYTHERRVVRLRVACGVESQPQEPVEETARDQDEERRAAHSNHERCALGTERRGVRECRVVLCAVEMVRAREPLGHDHGRDAHDRDEQREKAHGVGVPDRLHRDLSAPAAAASVAIALLAVVQWHLGCFWVECVERIVVAFSVAARSGERERGRHGAAERLGRVRARSVGLLLVLRVVVRAAGADVSLVVFVTIARPLSSSSEEKLLSSSLKLLELLGSDWSLLVSEALGGRLELHAGDAGGFVADFMNEANNIHRFLGTTKRRDQNERNKFSISQSAPLQRMRQPEGRIEEEIEINCLFTPRARIRDDHADALWAQVRADPDARARGRGRPPQHRRRRHHVALRLQRQRQWQRRMKKLHVVELPALTKHSEAVAVARQLQQDNQRFLAPSVVEEDQLVRLLERLMAHLHAAELSVSSSPPSVVKDAEGGGSVAGKIFAGTEDAGDEHEQGSESELEESAMDESIAEASASMDGSRTDDRSDDDGDSDDSKAKSAAQTRQDLEDREEDTAIAAGESVKPGADPELKHSQEGREQFGDNGNDMSAAPAASAFDEEGDAREAQDDAAKRRALRTESEASDDNEEDIQSEELECFSEDASDEDSV